MVTDKIKLDDESELIVRDINGNYHKVISPTINLGSVARPQNTHLTSFSYQDKNKNSLGTAIKGLFGDL